MNPRDLIQESDGYYLQLKTKRKRLTNFYLYLLEQEFSVENRRTSARFTAYQGKTKVGDVIIPEAAWRSPVGFRHAIGGLGNLVYYPSDSRGLTFIKIYVFDPNPPTTPAS